MPRQVRTKNRSMWIKPFIWLRNAIFLLILFSITITILLRWLNPSYTSFMLFKNVNDFQISQKISWQNIEDISPNLLIAVVAAEDQKFPNHHGFDLKAIQLAIEKNRYSSSLRGASTISQQVAKNIFLWPKKSLLRKGLEAYFTVLIEALWPKWRILEVYLNVAQFSPHLYGAKNAAAFHFRKSPKQLTLYESSLLAAVLPNPYKMNASKPSKYVNERANHIYQQAQKLGGHNYLQKIWN